MKQIIPWSDLRYGKEEIQAATQVLESGWPSQGKVSIRFQGALEDYLHSSVTLVNSGSSALMCALLAHKIGAHDTVLVPDFTYMATASVPALLGCNVIPIDCDRENYNIDLIHLMDAIVRLKPKAVIVTDIAGLPCQLWLLEKWAEKYHFILIEDAAEAFGSELMKKKVGSFNHTTTFSFETTKVLSTIQGGAITSQDKDFIERCRTIACYGLKAGMGHYTFDMIGTNFRTTDINSAIGLEQLKKVDTNIARRVEIMKRYREELPFKFQDVNEEVAKPSYWMALCSTENRFDAISRFNASGVEARIAFVPVHKQPFSKYQNSQEYPNADEVNMRGMTIPIYNGMTDEEVDYVLGVAKNQ